ncbi:hypothetical protein OBBRIDRAFT_740919 [Obba rivulosa]|uniref:Protein-S-isoprenylcysteine O-methyltransferase n=1 Tax=Obba rivulosa TaxID=1052685 RepID=A0A8E2DFD7_9APHY|nr:hypothetical protein OBBRIDRAFT_740919 [Obba rivulosa]
MSLTPAISACSAGCDPARPKLVTNGPYTFVRHPNYSGWLACQVGGAACLFGSGSWAPECGMLGTTGGKLFAIIWVGSSLLSSVMVCKWAVLEDEALCETFKGEWAEYARNTPYKMIPYIY